jgi:hypothetical protein
MLSKAEARKIMLSIAGMSEAPYFGKPAVFYAESFVGRVHDKEDAVALRVGTIEMRDVMLEAEPKLFYITDHYKPWPMLLARLKVLDKTVLKELVAARMGEIDVKAKKKKKTATPRLRKLPGRSRQKTAKKAKKLTRR